MHFSTITALATAILVGTGAALQVNWYLQLNLQPILEARLTLDFRYSDDNCGNYIDTTYFSGKGIHGNYQGAGSALFVTTDGCPGMIPLRFSLAGLPSLGPYT